MRFIFVFLISFLLINPLVFAQGQSGDSSKLEVFAELGSLLPDQIDGLDEILGMWGLGIGLSSNSKSYFFEYASGSGDDGEAVQDFAIGFRKDIELTGLAGMVGGGIDLFSITRANEEDKTYYGGVHFSAGIMALISKGLYARMNMKFNANPGVSMFLGFGLLYRPSEDI